MSSLFAYGTLMSEGIMRLVTGIDCSAQSAVLAGYARCAIKSEVFPAVVARRGVVTEGICYDNLSQSALIAIDRYEGPWYKRVRVQIRLAGTTGWAYTYVIKPSQRWRLERRDWSFDEFRVKHLEHYMRSIAKPKFS